MDWQQFLKDRQATLASGLVALLIIVVGFLVFNYFSKAPEETNQTTQSIETQEATPSGFLSKENPSTPPLQTDSKGQVSPRSEAASVSLPTNYEVVQGDHLWGISEKFYGDGHKWTEIAKANNIANPNLIYSGTKFTIPKVEASAQAGAQKLPATGNEISSQKTKYQVQTGDSLWSIAEQSYNNGFDWYKIKEANKDRVGTLPNGRPLITPNMELVIP